MPLDYTSSCGPQRILRTRVIKRCASELELLASVEKVSTRPRWIDLGIEGSGARLPASGRVASTAIGDGLPGPGCTATSSDATSSDNNSFTGPHTVVLRTRMGEVGAQSTKMGSSCDVSDVFGRDVFGQTFQTTRR